MSGAIPEFPQQDFMAWCSAKITGTTLPFTYATRTHKNIYEIYGKIFSQFR